MKQSILVKKQSKTIKLNDLNHPNYGRVDLCIDIRYDDECGNGHNSFSITGTLYEHGKRGDLGTIACGCLHDDIKILAPEYAHLIKWHLMSSDAPMHYMANTLYHAKDREDMSKPLGAVLKSKRVVQMHGVEQFPGKRNMVACTELIRSGAFEMIEIQHGPTDGYQFKPKYKVIVQGDETEYKWHEGEFDTSRELVAYAEAVQAGHVDIVTVPTKWNEASEPNLDAARGSACWEDATLEQLQDKEQLLSRIPDLLSEFIEVVEGLGFTY